VRTITGDASGRATVRRVLAQRRAYTTRRALLVAAAEQFGAVGYHAASLTEIVSAAGVTKGALYFHFADKRTLAEAVTNEMDATWHTVVTEIAARRVDPLTAMLAVVDAAVAGLIDDPIVRGGTRLRRDPLLHPAHPGRSTSDSGDTIDSDGTAHSGDPADAIGVHLRAAARAGLLRPTLGEAARERLARSITAMINGYHLECELSGQPALLSRRVREMWLDLLPLIATDDWLGHRGTLTDRLQATLNDRMIIEQATGVLAQRDGLSVDTALDRMRRHALTHHQRLTDYAHHILATEHMTGRHGDILRPDTGHTHRAGHGGD
jgi:AcrR family transcriptional regulator